SGDPEPRSGLRPRRDPQRDLLAIHRGHPDLRAERGLRDVDGHGAVDVQALPPEEAVRPHPERDPEIARLTAARTPLPLPGQTQLRARVHARRHVDDQLPLLPNLPAAGANRARLRRDLPSPVARGARPLDREATLTERDRPAPAALPTRPGPAAGRVPGPIARCALFGDGNGDGHLATPHRQLERDLHRILDVPSPLRRGPRPRPGPPPELEDRAEQVAEPADVRQVVEVEPAAP